MLDAIHKNYVMRAMTQKAAKETGKELVKIFQQYAEK